MIDEKGYLEAINRIDECIERIREYEKVVAQYEQYIRHQTQKALRSAALLKTPREIGNDWQVYFPNMSVKLGNAIFSQYNNSAFIDTRICDITKEQLLNVWSIGLGCWRELCQITGNKEVE